MTALTRMTKAQLIELAQRLTAENAQLVALHNTAAAALDKLRDDYVAIEERCVALDEENDALRAKQHDHNLDVAGLQYTINRVSAERDAIAARFTEMREENIALRAWQREHDDDVASLREQHDDDVASLRYTIHLVEAACEARVAERDAARRRAKQRRDAIIVDVICKVTVGAATALAALCIYTVSVLGFAAT